jgi:hypothetical protein
MSNYLATVDLETTHLDDAKHHAIELARAMAERSAAAAWEATFERVYKCALEMIERA